MNAIKEALTFTFGTAATVFSGLSSQPIFQVTLATMAFGLVVFAFRGGKND